MKGTSAIHDILPSSSLDVQRSERPLSGIRVLDFSRVLAGPLCSQILGDLGADILKIESPDVGDETRGWPPFEDENFGTVFLAVNRNKRSITVDLKTDAGRALVQRMAADSDVAIENFSTGVAERLGIDYDSLRKDNDSLIYCSISGFGRTGPMSHAAGYDVILQAFSGIMSLTGEPGGGHIRVPISPIDQVTGLNAVVGILAALMRRGKTQRGSFVETSLFETAVSLLNHPLQSFWKRGEQPQRHGSSHESLCPYEVFEASDGPVMIGVANNNQWRKFCQIAGLGAAANDPRFFTNAGRADHRGLVLEIVQNIIRQRTIGEWVQELGQAGIPVSPVNTLSEMLENPQTTARKIILDYELGSGTPVRGVATPFTLDGERCTIDRPPPAHGEHTIQILREFGYSDSEIDALSDQGAIAKSLAQGINT